MVSIIQKIFQKKQTKKINIDYDQVDFIASESEAYSDLQVDDIYIDHLIVDPDRIYIFIRDDFRSKINDIMSLFGLSKNECIFIVNGIIQGIEYEEQEFNEVFEILYKNCKSDDVINNSANYTAADIYNMEDTDKQNTTSLLTDEHLFNICEIAASICDRAYCGQNYKYDRDGNKYVKRYDTYHLSVIDTGITKGKIWYPISPLNPNKMFAATVLGGIGCNKFMSGHLLSGIGYLITGGAFGILPLIDCITMINGNYYYYEPIFGMQGYNVTSISKQKYFVDKPSLPKWQLILGTILSLIIGWAIGYVIYRYGMSSLTRLISGLLKSNPINLQ